MLFNSVKICLLTNNHVTNKRLMTAVPVWTTRGSCFVVLETVSWWDFIFQKEKYNHQSCSGRKLVVVNKAECFLALILVGIPESHF